MGQTESARRAERRAGIHVRPTRELVPRYALAMGKSYSQDFVVRWSDLDGNNHMSNTAYLDVCVDVRMGYFEARGFAKREFARNRIGPVVRRDEVDYYRELSLGESFTVDLQLAGASDDVTRFSLRNRFFRADRTLVTTVVSTGGWLDLEERRLVEPPAALREILLDLERTETFETLPSSLKGK